MFTTDFEIEIKKADVLQQIECYEGSSVYEEVVQEYEEIVEKVRSLCRPVFLMEKGKIGSELAREDLPEGTDVLMVLYSIGREVSEYATEAFAQKEYVKGMLADGMADSALFSMEAQFEPLLKEFCAQSQMGILRRLEAPHDISMMAQKVIWEKTKAWQHCGIGLTSGYMLDPVKSNSILYVLTEDKEVFQYQHNCRNCDRYDCKMRNVPDISVKVTDHENEYELLVKERESILEALIRQKASFGAVCGGRGTCGKCRIKVTKGVLPAGEWEKAIFTEEEIANGYRLACKAYPSQPLHIQLKFQDEAEFFAVAEYEDTSPEVFFENSNEKTALGLAIDIGTTTLAFQLVELASGKKVASYTAVNHQRNYGADVIARIQASVEGKKEVLQKLIRKDLEDGTKAIVKRAGVLPEQIKEVAAAGNTTMIHLLMGYSCESLGVYPFEPVNIKLIEDSYENLVGSRFLSARMRILPGISAFVGGDIVSGLYACEIDQKEGYSLLIDLGTNGEAALGNKEKLMVTSTAAGPAFEGGNITWGVGSIEGAVAGVKLTGNPSENKPELTTIGDKPPVGICGTGVIEVTAELVRLGLVDESGCLDDAYFENGYELGETNEGEKIVFTQRDVREVQLAKAAVRAGVETLLLRYGIAKSDISKVYLAGGFGFRLDCQKAIEIGMIPAEFAGKITAVGNSSLAGAVKYLLLDDGIKRTSKMGETAKEINLSADKAFNQFYMEQISFS